MATHSRKIGNAMEKRAKKTYTELSTKYRQNVQHKKEMRLFLTISQMSQHLCDNVMVSNLNCSNVTALATLHRYQFFPRIESDIWWDGHKRHFCLGAKMRWGQNLMEPIFQFCCKSQRATNLVRRAQVHHFWRHLYGQ